MTAKVLTLIILVGSSSAFSILLSCLRTSRVNHDQKSEKNAFSGIATALPMGDINIFGHGGSRSVLAHWACLELGLEYKIGDLTQNPHPFGQMPCLTDKIEGTEDPFIIFESGAILQYLNQFYGPESLTQAQKGAIASWLTWANASLDPICFIKDEEGQVCDTELRRPHKRIDRLNALLAGRDYLVEGAGFTVADIAVASYLLYVVKFFPEVPFTTLWPYVARYLKDCASRPTYGQAFGSETQAFAVEHLSNTRMFGLL